MNLSLFSIERELLELIDQREIMRDELAALPPDSDLSVVNDLREALEATEGVIKAYLKRELAKVDGIASAVRQFEATAKTAKEEADRLAGRAKALQGIADSIRERTIEVMEETGNKKLRGNLNTLTVAGNGGVQPLDIRQPDLVPDSLKRVLAEMPQAEWVRIGGDVILAGGRCKSVEPDNTKIRAKLESGEAVPGCILKERGRHLRIS